MSEPLVALKRLRQDTTGPIPISCVVKKPKVAILALAVIAVVILLIDWEGDEFIANVCE